ncbi:2619_t:CDS:2 [Paraglomus occultum]|uniref:2619_t:CDS:1 n=1 Tax=Paraglomus occultum TaxID=144539 RepID=A0A9N8VZQ5_9GLOM|nr:2619_t:CDS:2 [Paraglomus occultum]
MADESSPLLGRGTNERRQSFRERMSSWDTWWSIIVFSIIFYIIVSWSVFLLQSPEMGPPLTGSMAPCIYDLRIRGNAPVNYRYDYELWFSELTDEIYKRIGYDIDYYHQCEKLMSPPTGPSRMERSDFLEESESLFINSLDEDMHQFSDNDLPLWSGLGEESRDLSPMASVPTPPLMRSPDGGYFPFLYKIAELTSNSYNPRSPVSYELRELRWTPEYGETFLLTSRTTMDRYWFFKIPSAYISFGHVDGLASDDVLNCEYKLSWTHTLNGHVYKKCVKSGERNWKQVATVVRSDIGLEFFDADGSGRHQAIATKHKYSKRGYWYRTVAVYPDAPYPAVLVSMYTAHLEYLLNILDNDHIHPIRQF